MVLLSVLFFYFTATAEEFDLCGLVASADFASWKDEALIAQTHRAWSYIKARPHQFTEIRVNNRHVIHGVHTESYTRYKPRVLQSDEIAGKIFRHYTTPSGKMQILSSQRLRAGSTAYAYGPYSFSDLTGVFLTTPDFGADEVGLSGAIALAWVDVLLDPATVVLQLEPGIFLVPGSPEIPDWLRKIVLSPNGDLNKERFLNLGLSAFQLPLKTISTSYNDLGDIE